MVACDAIALLDKCSSYDTDLNIQNVLTSLGNYSYSVFFDLVNALVDGNQSIVISILDSLYNEGNDFKVFIDQFLAFCIDLNKYILFNNCALLKIPSSMENNIKYAVSFENASNYYNYLLDKLLNIKNMIKSDSNIKLTVEVCFIQICRGK